MSKVQLFVTCLVDLFRPEAGIAAVQVLERAGVTVEFPEAQTCCGQFSYNAGFKPEAAALARHWVATFESTEGPIVALSGSCAAMVIHSYPALLAEDAQERGEPEAAAARWRERAAAVAQRVWEWSQWVRDHVPPLAGPKPAPGPVVACHLGCHMRRLLKETQAPRAVLEDRGVAVREPVHAEECCGFGGTYSMTEPVVSTALADAKLTALDALRAEGAVCLTGADLGCLLHLEGRWRRRGVTFPVRYLAEVVDAAETGHWQDFSPPSAPLSPPRSQARS